MSVTVYNPANKRKDQLINEFVVRTKEFTTVFKDIQSFKENYPPQHYLIVGQRGAGKTTLMHRLKYAIEDDSDINDRIIPITFNEEQYGVSELSNVWEKISEILEDYHEYDGIVEEVNNEVDNLNFEEKSFEILTSWLQKEDQKIILFIDNLGDLLNKFEDKEVRRLREILMTSPEIRLIGASPLIIDQVLDYQKPLFEFFKTINLKGLSNSDIKRLLRRLSEEDDSSDIIDAVINKNPERIEILRILTGGVTRTVVLLHNIFVDNINGNSIRDLQLTLDALTPLYKHKMDDLPKYQQKIVDAVAKSWDATGVKEISKITRIESKTVSAQLRQLEKNQLIEKISTGKKNHLYQIKERFFNIWYLMRYGRKFDRNRVIWLVRFLESWCSKEELEHRIVKHIDALKDGHYEFDAALLLGEAYVACKLVSFDLKEELILNIKSRFPKEKMDSLSINDSDMYDLAFDYYENNEYSKAIDSLLRVEEMDPAIERFLIFIYYLVDDLSECIVRGNQLIEMGEDDDEIHQIMGYSYEQSDDTENAIKHYNLAIELGSTIALVDLGVLYYRQDKHEKAKRLLIKGLKNENTKSRASHYLGHVFAILDDDKKAQKYLEMAVELGDERAVYCLAHQYYREGLYDDALNYYQKSIDLGMDEAWIGLGLVSIEKGQTELGQSHLKRAGESEDVEILFTLAKVFEFELDDSVKAKGYYEKAYGLGHVESAHRLGHIFDELDDYKNAKKFLTIHIKSEEDSDSLFCLAKLFLRHDREPKKSLATIIKAKSKIDFVSDDYFLESEILLWNGELELSIKSFKDGMKLIDLEDQDINTFELIEYFVRLISLKHYNTALKLLKDNNLTDYLKPIYYVVMFFLKEDYPNEYLKMGNELKEVVEEIIDRVSE